MAEIIFDEKLSVFHLRNEWISYLIEIEEFGIVSHLYFGRRVEEYSGLSKYPRIDRSFSPNPAETEDRLFSRDTLLQEYPSFGNGDFRTPAISIEQGNGSLVSDFIFESFEIIDGKPFLEELPQAGDKDAKTLRLKVKDFTTQLVVILNYTIYDNKRIIVRSNSIENYGEPVRLRKAASMNIDFPARTFDLIHLEGAWARERMLRREPINTGIKTIDSKRGSSSHQENPGIIIAEPKTDEYTGEAYGFNLIYSGNHETTLQKDQYEQLRVTTGINSFQFDWLLETKDIFQTPEVILAYSDSGLNLLSQEFHQFISEHIIPKRFYKKERPILVNNWEATYFDFTEEKLVKIADEAQQLGIELFVLDDGWFGQRNSDTISLGDWSVNNEKFPNGLRHFANEIHGKGLQFGLWIEPEMISKESNLFSSHPDWALQIPDRPLCSSRGQYVLDFSRKEIRQHILNQLYAILDEVPVDYIKWDMNRSLTEVYSLSEHSKNQGSIGHRYVLGLYDFIQQLTSRYPHILFEGCSGGGGRFDLGMLYYMPQIWTSDNTDAAARLKIQYSTSLLYPQSTMGAHISSVPNHQTGRNISLKARGDIAMSGIFGYELDLTKLTEIEKQEVKEQIKFYKEHRKLLQFGKLHHLVNPYEENEAAWIIVSEDQSEAIFFYCRQQAVASGPINKIKLSGLNPNFRYEAFNLQVTGSELMNIGMYINPVSSGDYVTEKFYLKKTEKI